MKKFFYIIIKEYLQLIRDLPGLSILFVMPALLLIVITLSQEKVMTGRTSGMNIVVFNADSSALGRGIVEALKTGGLFDYQAASLPENAERTVLTGKSQLFIMIPEDATEKISALAHKLVNDTGDIGNLPPDSLAGIRLYYDPAALKLYKEALVTSVHLIIESVALQVFVREFTRAVRTSNALHWEYVMKKMADTDFEKAMPDFPYKQQVINQLREGMEKSAVETMIPLSLQRTVSLSSLVTVEEEVAGDKSMNLKPDLVKNNVPSFILFAMFFIVLPLAGSVINEKLHGTRDRLKTLPVSGFAFFSGKIAVYLVVCILQFIFMAVIGRYIFPAISQLPPLSLQVDPWALTAAVLASGLAAIGFGLLIGTLSRTYGQAAPLGSVLVVIMSILGGIFVPAFMMPDIIENISIISPLRWGTDAFFSIFARGAGVGLILPQLLALTGFFGICLVVSITACSKQT